MLRLRFAPSPTGDIHIGTLRSALFNYIIAKKLNGKLILRIEDTDKKREVAGSVNNLMEVMNEIGIKFDEGPGFGGEFGPYTQSERSDIYKKYYTRLIEEKKAYYCFCSVERLEILRNEQQANKQAPKYDKHCKNLSEDEIKQKIESGNKYVIRQAMPNEDEIITNDRLRGKITFKVSDLDDQVLVKSNGTPTYQLANVIDDHLMQITTVVRGEEWISSLPKNVLLYMAFGWEVPEYIHLPLILNKNGGKLSKRNGDVSVESFQRKGYLNDALINFCALQGWHPKEEGKEVYKLDEIIKNFKITDIKTSGAIFDIEKLNYLNGHYIRQLDLDSLTEKCIPYLKDSISSTQNQSKKDISFIKKVVKLEQERLKQLSEIDKLTEYLFKDDLEYPEKLLIWKKTTSNEIKNNLTEILHLLKTVPNDSWTAVAIEESIVKHIRAKEGKIGNYLWPMRVSLSGKQASPGPFEIAEVLEKDESLKRIQYAINKI